MLNPLMPNESQPGPNDSRQGLNESQLNAVQWEDGPLLLLAGPGSGKTTVLTYRIARMIDESAEKHFKILGLTFTNKAAAEMRDRIAALVPNAEERILLTTFHSFCADLLRQHGHHIGLKPDFTILAQDADRHSLLDEAIEQAGVHQVEQTGENLLPLVTHLIENDIAPDGALNVLRQQNFTDPESLSRAYRCYRSLMIERNSLDFVGLISEALGILRVHTGVGKQVRRIYPYVCVDEFQDTNFSQFEVLRHLVNPTTKNLFVVADDDQIIYQWNGASPERLRKIQEEFEMELHQLPENYRCPAEVVALANNLIKHNHDRYAGKGDLRANKKFSNSSVASVYRFSDFDAEAAWVADFIANGTPEFRAQCVVLARTRKLLEQVVDALEEKGVTGYLAARKNEFEGAPLQWLHSTFRLANSRTSRAHLRSVCKAFFSIEGVDLNVRDIVSHASAKDIDYLRSWAELALNRQELAQRTRQFIEGALLSNLADRLDFWKFEKAAFAWLDDFPGIRPDVEGVYDVYEDEKEVWRNLVNDISNLHGKNEVTLHLLLQELDMRSKSPEPPKGAVPCFTVHASKGLGFDHVFLVGMVEDQLPSWAAIKKGGGSREMQEERRNCFVAITRVQETLTMTFSSRVFGYPKQPSRFLYEMGAVER